MKMTYVAREGGSAHELVARSHTLNTVVGLWLVVCSRACRQKPNGERMGKTHLQGIQQAGGQMGGEGDVRGNHQMGNRQEVNGGEPGKGLWLLGWRSPGRQVLGGGGVGGWNQGAKETGGDS